ncbi:MAG: glutamine--fructose-6-phosphate aminotransferase, partial [Bacteroidetes bacterium]|nr:glutamine--fructose-6-phosphate aminotransferase [Bacteroidota bacterium]
QLIAHGYEFQSATDTEVLVQLIDYIYQNDQVEPAEAVRLALTKVVGAYGIIVTCKDTPDQLIVARKSSPIVIGVGEGEYIIASDAAPIINYTRDVIYMDDNEMAILTRDFHTIKTIDNIERTPLIKKIDMELEAIEKGGYEHFMLKEIFEQPQSIAESLRGRINPVDNSVYLGGLEDVKDQLKAAKRFIFV